MAVKGAGEFSQRDRHFMQEALKQAKAALKREEVPIGAVIVAGDRIIARAGNQVEQLKDSTAHAEIIALTCAFHALGSRFLEGATIYITLEPCLMCAGALSSSRIGRIVYAAPDAKNGYLRLTAKRWPFHPRTVLEHGLYAKESLSLMKEFFAAKREGRI
ncbi:MAG TPA: nucleoside deaminase, partial [Chitinophagaceae bacterium]|nr:nucleoside deaminase [Chitinophagaceae bacterium]